MIFTSGNQTIQFLARYVISVVWNCSKKITLPNNQKLYHHILLLALALASICNNNKIPGRRLQTKKTYFYDRLIWCKQNYNTQQVIIFVINQHIYILYLRSLFYATLFIFALFILPEYYYHAWGLSSENCNDWSVFNGWGTSIRNCNYPYLLIEVYF